MLKTVDGEVELFTNAFQHDLVHLGEPAWRPARSAGMAAFLLADLLGSHLTQPYLTACNDNKLQFMVMGHMYLGGHPVAVSARVLNKWL